MVFFRSRPELVQQIKESIKAVITEKQYNRIDPSVMEDFGKIGAFIQGITLEDMVHLLKCRSS